MTVVLTDKFKKRLGRLDKPMQNRILDYIDELAILENPRSRGKPLTSNLAGLWRYRIGDYRVICNIIDSQLVIIAVDIGHRREIYKL